jgi:predicted lactoylglutathione lyase
MKVESLTPILNVSNIVESFAWFEKLGWQKGWDWGDPPTFGGVCNGNVEIFLCQNGQGSRGGSMPEYKTSETIPSGWTSFTGDDEARGVWMSWWVESPAAVDALYQLAIQNGLMVTMPPTDEPWNVREFHLHHPDGHLFRVGAGLEEE